MKVKIFKVCVNCGKKKNANTSSVCCNDCRREHHKKTLEKRKQVRDYLINDGRKIFSKPIDWREVTKKVMKKVDLSVRETGRMVSELCQCGYIRVYPSIYSTIKVCYLTDTEGAIETYKKLWREHFDSLSEKAQNKLLKNASEARALKKDIQDLSKTMGITQICKKLNIRRFTVKRALI